MINLKDYKSTFNKAKINIVQIWLIITIFIILLIVSLAFNFYYEENYQNTGIGIKNSYIETLVNIEDISKITDNQKIIINNKEYHYDISKINSEIQKINNNLYQAVLIKINKKILENEYISYIIPIKKINFYNYIKNKIKGGI